MADGLEGTITQARFQEGSVASAKANHATLLPVFDSLKAGDLLSSTFSRHAGYTSQCRVLTSNIIP